ncbi:MAG: queuosine precursor transporter [Candidatus Dependentiae bacterium]|nr:queuosine precursor transporter [Candidatus Dependentiae bacterium]
MIINELIFLVQTSVISIAALAALYLGKEALVAFICLVCIMANLLIIKQTMLFGFNATCADAFTIGATLGLNLLQEYFGRTITRKTIWINFFLLIFYAIMSQIHLAYVPSVADSAHDSFKAILGFMPRIVVASFTVYLIAQMVDYLVYGFLKHICVDRFLIARNYGSMMVSQLVDTILFSFLGLYGIVDNIGEIIVVSYFIKVVAIGIASPFVALSRIIIKK